MTLLLVMNYSMCNIVCLFQRLCLFFVNSWSRSCVYNYINSLNVTTELLNRNHVLLFFCVVSVETQAELFTLYPGDRLDLNCIDRDSVHSVNWTKDHVVVVDGEHTRIRKGQLEIESVELSDSGLYTCTTFGNHSVYFNVTGKSQKQCRKIVAAFVVCLNIVSFWL